MCGVSSQLVSVENSLADDPARQEIGGRLESCEEKCDGYINMEPVIC